MLMAFKWNMLLKVKNINITLYKAAKIYYISNFLGLVLPSTVGADIIKTHFLRKESFALSDIIASILVERFLGFVGLFLYGLTSAFLFMGLMSDLNIDIDKIIVVFSLISIIGIILLFLSFNESFINKAVNFLRLIENKKYFSKFSSKVQRLILSYYSYKTKKLTLVIFLALTLVEIFISILINFYIAISLQLDVPLYYFIIYVPIMMLLIRLPISFSGIGINEGGSIYFLGLIGVTKSYAFTLGILDYFISIIGLIPGAFFYAFNRTKLKENSGSG